MYICLLEPVVYDSEIEIVWVFEVQVLLIVCDGRPVRNI